MFKSLVRSWKSPRIWVFVQSAFVMTWLANLASTDSLFSIYALCGILCVFCLSDNVAKRRYRPEFGFLSLIIVSTIFSILVFAANYSLFAKIWYMDSLYYPTNVLKNGLNAICTLIGGFFVAYQIILFLVFHIPKVTTSRRDGKKVRSVFLLVFFSVLIIDLVYLFFDEYPGHISADGRYQIIQGYTNSYMNDHPFWNTLYIKGVLTIGYWIFGSANGAMALFSILQILMMAACFAYAFTTLYQTGIPKWLLLVVLILYTLMPYNIVFSISMYKDVLFSLSVLLMIVSLYRMLRNISFKPIWDQIVFAIGICGICFSRTNGFALTVITLVFYLPYLLKRNKKFLIILFVLLLLIGIVTGPVVSALGVTPAETSEAFSLPLQQMARVVCDGRPLSESQEALLGRIFDLDDLSNVYVKWYADPIKREVRENDNVYFSTHLLDYLKLWVELGVEYPLEYFKAWVDQTKGYWNGGYAYFQYVEEICENEFGFAKTAGNNPIAKLIDLYFGLTRQAMFFEPLNSIGLQVWFMALCCYLNARRKRPEYMLSIPLLMIVAGLLIGTPVFAEFRYAYPIFMACPFVASVSIYEVTEKAS